MFTSFVPKQLLEMSEINYTKIDFDSVGAKLRGRFYRSSSSNSPLVIMAHGFTATDIYWASSSDQIVAEFQGLGKVSLTII